MPSGFANIDVCYRSQGIAVNLSSKSRRREAASPYRVVEEAAFFLLPQ